MPWFNYYGLIIMACLMLPNVIMALRHKEAFENRFKCKVLEIAEQIGRYGSFAFMIINLPYACFGWLFSSAETTYLIVNGVLIAAYELIWVIMRKNNNLTRAVLLSVIPSVIFVFSGIMTLNVPLIAFAALFSVCHVTISIKNAR